MFRRSRPSSTLLAVLLSLFFADLAPVGPSPARADWPPPVPADWTLSVRETAGVARAGEIVRTGVPVPRSLGLVDPSGLVVVDAGGNPVPAEIGVRARWHAGLGDPSAPVQWLLVSFPATVGADATATYRVVRDGSAGPNPTPATALVIRRSGDRVTVDTGAATFVLGASVDSLLDQATPAGGTTLVTGGNLEIEIDGAAALHDVQRSVVIEEAGELVAVVRVEGAYGAPSVGGGGAAGGIGSSRRYLFRAGSPVVEVQQVVRWEGDRCGLGTLECNGSPNGRLLGRWRNALDVNLQLGDGGAGQAVRLVGSRAGGSASAARSAGQEAYVRQLRRSARQDPLVYERRLPGAGPTQGTAADGASLAWTGSAGTVAIALERMHRYEPQALRVTADDRLALDLADDGVWLGARQGAFARFALGVWPSDPGADAIERQLWAQLDHPLQAWASPEWFAASRATKEFPVGPLDAAVDGYDALVGDVLDTTYAALDSRGLAGLMTFGLYPRIWGTPLFSDEIDCFGNDPTPADDWDDPYWCALWTDYHDTAATVPLWAMRTGQVEHLHELAFPAARRMLFTQVLQCAPGDPFFYCGQAPTGYGGYRADNNGSHAYFQNLVLYYWLSGDESVLYALERGAESMRTYLCPSRAGSPPGPVCADDRVPDDDWAAINGRTAVQWQRAFRFLGLARDPSYLDDWQSALSRWLTLYYARPSAAGAAYGLSSNYNGQLTSTWLDSAGTYWTDQLWMLSLYDYDSLWRFRIDTVDAPLATPALSPASTVESWGRTLGEISVLDPRWNDGTPNAPWPNEVRYTWSGPRIGGSLDALAHAIDDDGDGQPCEICGDDDGGACFDLCLYDTGKAALAGPLWRAADSSGDGALRTLATRFATFGVDAARADMQPLSKAMGLYLGQLHPAVARASYQDGSSLFADGFEGGGTAAWQ